ncbi:MAG TPA: Crp/Fnr family transcriptional regulator [Leucothrix mucor]|nr:Crp/Fnr family transcriptional regulator [Leucothrix mucor]
MFPSAAPAPQLSKEERKLCKYYKKLNDNERKTLLLFAEFLTSKEEGAADEELVATLQEPLSIPAVDGESVVKGIKRLRSSYFMIEDQDLLHEVSALMTEHVMQGVSTEDVMSKIEIVFEGFYGKYKKEFIEKKGKK